MFKTDVGRHIVIFIENLLIKSIFSLTQLAYNDNRSVIVEGDMMCCLVASGQTYLSHETDARRRPRTLWADTVNIGNRLCGPRYQ